MVCLPYVHYIAVHAGNGLVRQLSDIRQIVQYEREDTTSCLVSQSSWQALMSVGNTEKIIMSINQRNITYNKKSRR
jgi:hypothetical protein